MRFGLFLMGTRSGTWHDILDQVCYAEELGFDTVLLAERHFRHGDLLCPSPFSLGAAIAARTRRIRIGTAASILPLHHPLLVAEEAATLDILSGGRLDFGIARASLDEHSHAVFQSPRDEAGARFEEALDIIKQAWTSDHLCHRGRYYDVPAVSGLTRPLQKPHPPIYLVAVTPETTALAARGGYPAFVPGTHTLAELRKVSAIYWNALQRPAAQRSPVGLAVNRFIYVADSDARALHEIRRPFLTFVLERAPDLRAALTRKYGKEPHLCFERFVEDFCLFGSPESVGVRLAELEDALGLSYLLCSLNFVTLEHALCVRSMELFAQEVLPLFSPVGERYYLQEVEP